MLLITAVLLRFHIKSRAPFNVIPYSWGREPPRLKFPSLKNQERMNSEESSYKTRGCKQSYCESRFEGSLLGNSSFSGDYLRYMTVVWYIRRFGNCPFIHLIHNSVGILATDHWNPGQSQLPKSRVHQIYLI